jgi:hypothetical protein
VTFLLLLYNLLVLAPILSFVQYKMIGKSTSTSSSETEHDSEHNSSMTSSSHRGASYTLIAHTRAPVIDLDDLIRRLGPTESLCQPSTPSTFLPLRSTQQPTSDMSTAYTSNFASVQRNLRGQSNPSIRGQLTHHLALGNLTHDYFDRTSLQ